MMWLWPRTSIRLVAKTHRNGSTFAGCPFMCRLSAHPCVCPLPDLPIEGDRPTILTVFWLPFYGLQPTISEVFTSRPSLQSSIHNLQSSFCSMALCTFINSNPATVKWTRMPPSPHTPTSLLQHPIIQPNQSSLASFFPQSCISCFGRGPLTYCHTVESTVFISHESGPLSSLQHTFLCLL